MRAAITLAVITLAMTVAAPAVAKCSFSVCDGQKVKTYNSRGVISGSIYNPGNNRRLQIRDSRRRIIGYIEPSGKVTDTRRRRLGRIEVAR